MIVGITGGIGCGKSVVSKIIGLMGYPVYDSDKNAKKIVDELSRLKISEITMNRLIETALGIESNTKDNRKYTNATKNTRKILNLMYRSNKSRFISNFREKMTKFSGSN